MKKSIQGKMIGVVLCAVLVAVMFLPASGFGKDFDLSEVYSPKQLADFLKAQGRWVPLPIPDSGYVPGAIIELTWENVPGGGAPKPVISWIDKLTEFYAKDAVLPIESRTCPEVKFTAKKEFKPKPLLKLFGWEGGPEIEKVRTVDFQITVRE